MGNGAAKIFFCQECGHRDEDDTFSATCECPRCGSTDVIDYALWKRFATETPPPRRIDAAPNDAVNGC